MPAKSLTDEDLDLARSIGERMRELREAKGYSGPRAVGRAAGLDGDELTSFGSLGSSYERGRRLPRLQFLMTYAATLGVPTSYFLGDLGNLEEVRHESYLVGYRAAMTDAGEAILMLRKRRGGANDGRR